MENITNNISNTISWEDLRKEGLQHLQALSGHIWTDYHIHDPGVTILELLCYAITDLNSRLSQDIANILTENGTEPVKHFFSPREILTINPVTINDYRKLLIDLPGVKNAWLTPVTESEPALYYDHDNNALLYDFAPGAQRIALRGLYRVFIEKDEAVTDDQELQTAVLKKLHEHRNLGEDFLEVQLMEEETISVFSDIQIDENADADEVMGAIYYDLKNFISPRVKQYSLKRMLRKGKTIEQIFTGPQLEHGFIDDEELGIDAKPKELHTSDLIRIIMAHPEVKNIRNLFIANVPNPDIRQKQEWALSVDSTRALLLEPFNRTKIRLFKNETLSPVSSTNVAKIVRRLEEESSREIFDDPAMDLSETLGEASTDLTEYSSIGYKLPAIYGVSETGLPSTASALRRIQAKQLRAYLLFFEQILVNYLKQLDSFKRLYAFKQNRDELLKGYFIQLLPEELWEEDFPEIESMIKEDPTERLAFSQSPFNRRNHILDHLLAQFNEKFADYALFGYQYNLFQNVPPGEKERYFLSAKADFLENYPELSYNRNRAYNYLEGSNNGALSSTDGLKNLIAAKLGITLGGNAGANGLESEEFFIVEHIMFRPDTSLKLDFVCSERIPENYQPDPYSYRLTFVIPAKAGRFGNSKFKELAYTTIANETPAHIGYSVLEFNSEQMEIFKSAYRNYLTELIKHQQGNSVDYYLYRSQLMEVLGIGRPKLPVLHLDAEKATGDQNAPTNETPITKWIDLSRNNHHAIAQTVDTAPKLIKPSVEALPVLRFDEQSCLRIHESLVQEDFSIVAVFKTTIQSGMEDRYFPLITGHDSNKELLGLGFNGKGDLVAVLNKEFIILESEPDSFHIAEFIYDHTLGELRLFLDGALQITKLLAKKASPVSNAVVIEPGIACDLGEVIILDSVLTGSRKRKLEEYLSEKWLVPLSAVSSIAKPVLHLDTNAFQSVIRDDKSNKVSQWNDLSEAKIVVNQTEAALQPLYLPKGLAGLPALSFNDAALEISNAGQEFFQDDFTIALVYQARAGEGRLLDGTATANDGDRKSFTIAVNDHGGLLVRDDDQELKLDATLKETHLAIISAWTVAGKSHLSIWLDGKYHIHREEFKLAAFSNCPDNLVIGRSRTGESGFKGIIGEMVIFNKTFSAWERQRLEGFLADKWQIDISGVDTVAAPVLHLDAACLASVRDEKGMAPNEGTKVYQWLDLGITGNHAVQNNYNRRPEFLAEGINNLGAIKFTQEKVNNDDYYDDSLNVNQIIQNDFTIMAVFKPDAAYYNDQNPALLPQINNDTQWTEGVALIDADCSGSYNDFGLSLGKSGESLIVMGGIGDRLTKDNTIRTRDLNLGAAHFITFTRERLKGEVKLYADGLLHAQADLRDDVVLNDSRTIKIGAFNSEGLPFRGLIGEIVIFNQVLNDWQRQRIEEYLSAKWNIKIATLPVNNAGLSLHLDAQYAISITKDEQGRVSQWIHNKNIIASQEPAEYQPIFTATGINELPALQFNNSMLKVVPEITEFDDFTLTIVFNAQTTGNMKSGWDEAGIIDHYDNQNNFGIAITRNNALRARIDTKTIDTPVAFNKPHIGVISRDGEAVKIHLNGLAAVQDVCNSHLKLDELTIGAIRQSIGEKVSKGYYHGAIAEIILFNRALEEQERQSLEQYLALKWQIDISGINSIAKPVLHLDASRLATIIFNEEGKVSAWLDRNGHHNYASQTESARQPLYLENTCNGLGILHFNRSCLTLGPSVKDDFAVIIVYRPEPVNGSDNTEYMPVSPDAFTVIDGIDSQCSANIWNHLYNKGYINDAGMVLTAFTPGEDDFTLDLPANLIDPVRATLESEVNAILSAYDISRKLLPEDAFTAISGVTKGLAQTIWSHLVEQECLSSDGKVLKNIYTPENNDFGYTITEMAIIDVILAENWLEGTGLFDGNCAGERGQLNKRDFGILVGKGGDGQLSAGIGVPDEKDYQLTRPAVFDQWHIALFTRVKETGETRLYVDDLKYDEQRIARNVSLKDSEQFTIGAVNTGGNYFYGDIAEIIVLNTVPGNDELATIQSYLAKKWGITQ